MTKATKTKTSPKAKRAASRKSAATAEAPRRHGGGRPPGQPNRKTIAMREAFASVYAQLQEEEGDGKPHGHLLKVAKQYPLEFYRLAVRTLPLQIEMDGPAIGVVVFRGIND